MSRRSILNFCAWGGVINMATYFVGMILAGFLPVPSPALSETQVLHLITDNLLGVRIGSVFMLVSGLFLVPLIGLISALMKRIEGDLPVLAYGQLVAGTLGILFFYLPAVLFFVMAFRPDRSPELIYLFNDFAWIFMIVAWPSFVFQNTLIGVAILGDKSATPLFPRWLGFFQLWTACLYLGASMLPFFKTGPFAWNGFFAFWVPALVFFFWDFIMAFMLLKAIKKL